MLTHTYLLKAVRKIKVNIFTHQADSHLMSGLMSDLVNGKFRKIVCSWWNKKAKL